MIKLLHSADWHLDAPLSFRNPSHAQFLREHLLRLPEQISGLCRELGCQMLLLSGDLFDGAYTVQSLRAVQNALEDAAVPTFIAPGNHDFVGPESPWLSQLWPGNVHIFTHPAFESVDLPNLDCQVYGAGFIAMDCPGLLQDFTPTHTERYAVGVLHGDPTQAASPYCPVTALEAERSGLDYLALGHIHKGGAFRSGKTLCAWPGCPMGRGYDETGEKGVLLVTLEDTAESRFIPLDVPRFHDLEIPADAQLSGILPPVGNNDFYRITFTGVGQAPDLAQLTQTYSHFPHLTLRDKTTPPVDLWSSTGEDTFEGNYFKRLQDGMLHSDGQQRSLYRLAAELSRKLMDGQEVVLP